MSDPVVQQIKDRINIVDIVGQYVSLRRAGRSFTGRCPFHKERTPSFHVSPERGTYKCFGCGEGGDIFSFLQKIDGADFPTVLKQLADKAGVKLEDRKFKAKAPEEQEREERLYDVCEAAVKFFEEELDKRKEVQEYLGTRGVKEETVAEWRLGYAPATWDTLSKHLQSLGFGNSDIVDAGFGVRSEKRQGEVFDRFRGRIIFPIFDIAGRPVAVSGRYFEKVPGSKEEGEPAKYVNSPETALFKKSRTLYGFDKARATIRRVDCILLVEGQFDLILAHQSGLPFAVALSGTALTPEHLSLLGRLSKRLVLALDADAAGIRAGLRSAHMALSEGFEVKVPTFPEGKDPADVAKENPELLKAAIRTAKGVIEFFVDALRASAKDIHAYSKIVEAQVLPLIAVMHSSIEREQQVRVVAMRLGVSESAVTQELRKVKASPVQEYQGEVVASPQIHEKSAESTVTPLEKKAAMLLFGWSEGKEKLTALWGKERAQALEEKLGSLAEEYRFRFDSEVGEHNSEATVAADVLADLERAEAKERFKMKFL